jgi:hypothetical protein
MQARHPRSWDAGVPAAIFWSVDRFFCFDSCLIFGLGYTFIVLGNFFIDYVLAIFEGQMGHERQVG